MTHGVVDATDINCISFTSFNDSIWAEEVTTGWKLYKTTRAVISRYNDATNVEKECTLPDGAHIYSVVYVLYNDYWHGFRTHSQWSRVLWQAVTLGLVRRDRPVDTVLNRKETTWYENHVVRFWQSVQSESGVERGIRSCSVALVSSLTILLARGCKRGHPLTPGRKYGASRRL